MTADGSELRERRRKKIKAKGALICYFCKNSIEGSFDVHHIDEDHSNDNVDNLASAHGSCHRSYHKMGNKARLGHKHSEETKMKMRASQQARRQFEKEVV